MTTSAGLAVRMCAEGQVEVTPLHPDDLVRNGQPGPMLPPQADPAAGVIVQARASGVCGSDLHTLAGGHAIGHVMGHELVGNVVWQGDAVTGDWLGRDVVVAFNVACGTCRPCVAGQTYACTATNPARPGATYGMGADLGGWPGLQASHAFVPHADHNLAALPAGVDPVHAVLAADVLPTALHALMRSGVDEGDRVWVVGGGAIGATVAHVAATRGAQVAVSERRALVRERLGATGLTTTSAEDPRELLGGSVDHVLDCVGAALPVESLERLVSRIVPAGTIGLVGARTQPTDELAGALLATVWRRGLSLHAGITPARRHLEPALDWLADHGSDLAATLALQTFPLDRAEQAYAHLRQGAGKPVLVA